MDLSRLYYIHVETYSYLNSDKYPEYMNHHTLLIYEYPEYMNHHTLLIYEYPEYMNHHTLLIYDHAIIQKLDHTQSVSRINFIQLSFPDAGFVQCVPQCSL